MFRRLLKNKFYLIFMIMVIALFPTAIGQSSISNTSMVAVAMGIDKLEDEYEASLVIIVPKQNASFNQSLEVISAKGETVRQALNRLNLHTGKEIGLAHCGMLVVNDKALEDDIMIIIDYLMRDSQIDNSCVLVNTNKSSKELLQANQKLQDLYGVDSAKMLDFLNNEIFWDETNIEIMVRSKLSNNNTAFMAYIELSDNSDDGLDASQEPSGGGSSGDDSGGSSSGGSSSGSSSGSQGQDKQSKVVSNLGEVSLLKNGVKVAVAREDTMKGLYWLGTRKTDLEFFLEDYSGDDLVDAKISLMVNDKSVDRKYKFIDDKPVFECNIGLEMKITEIVTKDESDRYFVSYKDYISDNMKDAIKNQIKNTILESVDFLRKYKTDIIAIYRGFEKYHYHKWNDFISKLEDKDDFLNYVDFDINIEMDSRQK